METIKCKFCQSEIPKVATRCPHCHGDLRSWGRRHPIIATILILVAFSIVWSFVQSVFSDGTSAYRSPSLTSGVSAPAVPSGLILELENVTYSSEAGNYFIGEGLVKNISSEPQRQVTAVVFMLDKDSNFIKSDDALIDYDPLLPGQSSPFKVIMSDNPLSAKGRIQFKYLLGGEIPMRRATSTK